MIFVPFGDDAVLAEVADAAAVAGLVAGLGHLPHGVRECVPAARTVLVTFDPAVTTRGAVEAWVRSAATHPPAVDDARTVTLTVDYAGDDLAETAALLGVSAERLVGDHLAARWTVAFTGFAPGFGYLTSPDWPHRVPRLSSPRTAVPAGSVALADAYCGAYPRSTPGGWRLIGTTDAVLFDLDRAEPALLAPGTRVRFREAR